METSSTHLICACGTSVQDPPVRRVVAEGYLHTVVHNPDDFQVNIKCIAKQTPISATIRNLISE